MRRFLVAALDPAYGLLTLRQLEPEYDEALGRFRSGFQVQNSGGRLPSRGVPALSEPD